MCIRDRITACLVRLIHFEILHETWWDKTEVPELTCSKSCCIWMDKASVQIVLGTLIVLGTSYYAQSQGTSPYWCLVACVVWCASVINVCDMQNNSSFVVVLCKLQALSLFPLLPCDYAKPICTVLLSRFCLSVRLSVRPSVCLSNACIVTKRKHLAKKVQSWLGSHLRAFQWA